MILEVKGGELTQVIMWSMEAYIMSPLSLTGASLTHLPLETLFWLVRAIIEVHSQLCFDINMHNGTVPHSLTMLMHISYVCSLVHVAATVDFLSQDLPLFSFVDGVSTSCSLNHLNWSLILFLLVKYSNHVLFFLKRLFFWVAHPQLEQV